MKEDRVRTDMLLETLCTWQKITHYIFKNTPANIQISEDYFNQVSDNEYCFIENQIVDILKAKKVVVYRWDKVYPADYKLPLRQYKLVSTLEFQGYSHDKIVKEVYERNETIKK